MGSSLKLLLVAEGKAHICELILTGNETQSINQHSKDPIMFAACFNAIRATLFNFTGNRVACKTFAKVRSLVNEPKTLGKGDYYCLEHDRPERAVIKRVAKCKALKVSPTR